MCLLMWPTMTAFRQWGHCSIRFSFALLDKNQPLQLDESNCVPDLPLCEVFGVPLSQPCSLVMLFGHILGFKSSIQSLKTGQKCSLSLESHIPPNPPQLLTTIAMTSLPLHATLFPPLLKVSLKPRTNALHTTLSNAVLRARDTSSTLRQ